MFSPNTSSHRVILKQSAGAQERQSWNEEQEELYREPVAAVSPM